MLNQSAKYSGHFVERSRLARKNECGQIYTLQLTKDEDDLLVTSHVFHYQDQSVQQYSGPQKVGRGEEADLRRHGRTRWEMTYKRWVSTGKRPSLLLV